MLKLTTQNKTVLKFKLCAYAKLNSLKQLFLYAKQNGLK